jgi:hypothetical protein
VSTQPNHGSRPVSTDFCNKIGTKRTSSNVGCVVANGGKADIVERRGDIKEMGTGMELASSAEGTNDIQSGVSRSRLAGN